MKILLIILAAVILCALSFFLGAAWMLRTFRRIHRKHTRQRAIQQMIDHYTNAN